MSAAPTAFADAGRFSVAAPDGGTVHMLAVDPANPSNLYAGSLHAGVFRSRDGGDSWQAAREGLSGVWVSALAVAPSDPRVLYAAIAGPGAGLFRSRDRGTTWTAVGGETVPGAWGLAVHPTDPDVVVVANGDRVWKTADAGATWADITPGAPAGVFLTFRVPLFDPADPSHLYMGSNGGILKSTDDGETWTREQPEAFVLALILDPLHPQTLWAGTEGGVWKTLDGGVTWSFLPLPIDGSDAVTALAVDPVHPQTVYAAAGSSPEGETVFRSDDGGGTWRPLLVAREVLSLAVAADPPRTVWAGLRGLGVLRSRDGGTTWSPARRGLQASAVSAVALDPAQPRTLVVGLDDGPAALVRSEDSGETWAPVAVELGVTGAGFRTDALRADPARSGLLYGIFSGIVGRSWDFGRTWEALSESPPFPVLSLALTGDPESLVVTARELVPCDLGLGCEPFPFLHLFHTADGGESWQEALPPSQAFLGPGILVSAPSDPDRVYFVRENLFASSDGGVTWSLIAPLPQPTLIALAVDPQNPRILYAGTRLGAAGVLRSLDGGETWHARGTGLPHANFASQVIRDIVIDPRDPQRLYAASDLGVFESRNGGASWQPFSEGLVGLLVTVLALEPSGPGTLWAGGPSGGGLFSRVLAGVGCTEGPTALCLQGGRFRVQVSWQDFQGGSGTGHAVPLLDESGAFWFFAPDNLELVVKVLDGRPVNGHFWVFVGSLTNVAFEITVTDTATGETWHHSNPAHHFASFGDVTAF